MKKIKVKTPAKINLSLEIIKKRPDGFHEIDSIMQAVSLYDYIEITVSSVLNNENIIEISGDNKLIPYDNTNLCWIAADNFLKKAKLKSFHLKIHIQKNIPVAAGLAGGSSNAAGVLIGLNNLFDNILKENEINELASSMGSDINFCLKGGTQKASSRGEILEKLPTPDLKIIIAKPKNLFISAKEAYTKYAELSNKPENKSSREIIKAIKQNSTEEISRLLINNLENAILPSYPQINELKTELKNRCLNAIMSGSGPTVFGVLKNDINNSELTKENECFTVHSINNGISIVE